MADTKQRYDGKVAIITGAARGIGLEIARRMAQTGAAVALVDVAGDDALAAAAALNRQGFTAIGVGVDVSRREAVRQMVEAVAAQWGRIDILVNNAGICPMTPLYAIDETEWDRVLAINLKGPFLCAQAVAPLMQRQGAGKIINIASSAGQMGGLAVGLHYSASKAGILGLTKSLARLLAPAIQVNAVAPGTTVSEMTAAWDADTLSAIVRTIPMQRLGQPTDVAAAVLFLASNEADFITGQTLSVNGGLWMG